MRYMFNGASSFNSDISKWNVGKVTDMLYMFNMAESFNFDISTWDIGKVTNMNLMFRGTSSFTQTLCGAWRDSNAEKTSMFFGSSGKIGSAADCAGFKPTS